MRRVTDEVASILESGRLEEITITEIDFPHDGPSYAQIQGVVVVKDKHQSEFRFLLSGSVNISQIPLMVRQ